MTKLLEKAIAKVKALPEERQDEAAELLLHFASEVEGSASLTEAQRAEIARRLAGEPNYASPDKVDDFFRRFGITG